MNVHFPKSIAPLSAILFASIATAGAVTLSGQSAVDQIGLKFTKKHADLKVGEVMKFHNSDDVIHNIMTIDSQDMTEDYGLQKPGEIIEAKFPEAGEFQVRCSIHPKMKMTISVSK